MDSPIYVSSNVLSNVLLPYDTITERQNAINSLSNIVVTNFNSNVIPYASSNAVKNIIIYDTPAVNKKCAFYCSCTAVIYPNYGNTAYYKYDLNLSQYTKTGYIDIGQGSGDPYIGA